MRHTLTDNVKDCIAKGRGNHSLSGGNHAGAKLTWAKGREIRRLYNLGCANMTELAKQFNVVQRTVSGIIAGASWKES